MTGTNMFLENLAPRKEMKGPVSIFTGPFVLAFTDQTPEPHPHRANALPMSVDLARLGSRAHLVDLLKRKVQAYGKNAARIGQSRDLSKHLQWSLQTLTATWDICFVAPNYT